VADVLDEVRETTDPERVVAIAARRTRDLNERFGDIMRALYFAAQTEPAAAPIWDEGVRRHRRGAGHPRVPRAGCTSPRAPSVSRTFLIGT